MILLHCLPALTGGGAERQLGYLARAQAEAGDAVHIAFQAGSAVPEILRHPAIRLHPLPHRGNHDPLLLLRLIRLMRAVKPDIVQSWILQMDILAGLAALLTRRRWILREPNSAARYAGGGLKIRVRHALGRRAAAIVANSPGGCAYWGGRARLIPNGMPVEEIAATPPADSTALGIPADAPLILFAGRFVEQKNPLLLAEALLPVLAARPDMHAVLAGDGPLRPVIEAAIAGHPRIHLPGFLDPLWPWMRRAAVLALPSRYEGHPNVALEALAAGTPVVLSDIPAHAALPGAKVTTAEQLAAALLQPQPRPALPLDCSVEGMRVAYGRVYREVMGEPAGSPIPPRE